MRLAIGGIPAHGLAQPENRRLRIFLRPVGVAQIEVVVRIVLVELERLIEVITSRARFAASRAAASESRRCCSSAVAEGDRSASVRSVANASSSRLS